MAYGTLIAANAYHLARNNTAWADASPDSVKNGALQRASDYIDNTYRARFPGTKTGGRAQLPEWPRTDATDVNGEEIGTTEVPIEIEYATYELALLVVRGVDLNPVAQGGTIKRERVKAGPVESETEYADDVEAYNSFTIVDGLLSSLLKVSNGAQYDLLRA